MKLATTKNFNEILKTIQTLKQKILQNKKLSTVLRELGQRISNNDKKDFYEN